MTLEYPCKYTLFIRGHYAFAYIFAGIKKISTFALLFAQVVELVDTLL